MPSADITRLLNFQKEHGDILPLQLAAEALGMTSGALSRMYRRKHAKAKALKWVKVRGQVYFAVSSFWEYRFLSGYGYSKFGKMPQMEKR